MNLFIYRGCQNEYEGWQCKVLGQFETGEDCFREWMSTRTVGRLNRDRKYRVRFRNGEEVNVYGRNLYAVGKPTEEWPEHEIYTHPKPRDVYRYVSVQLLEAGSKKYHFLNADVELTERDLVVVQSRGGYTVGRVWGCWREDECNRPQKFEHAYAYVEHRIDEERMSKIREKDHRMKDLDRLIKQRLKELRESIELDAFIAKDEQLANLVEERQNLKF